jgi:hypothetical protein
LLFCCLEKIIFAIFVFPIPPPTYFFRKHVNYEEDKNKVPMNKPYNIQNTNICNGIFHISFFKALLTNECEATRDETTRSPLVHSGQVPMWSSGMGIILSYFLLFAMFMNWVSGDCYLYIHVLQKGNAKM